MAILAIENPTFQRAMRIISDITNANPAAVTTTFAHQYETGDIVRIDIPLGYGMSTLNGQIGTITVTGPTTFTLDIDTTHYDPFEAPADYPESYQYAQVVPVGEANSKLTSATQNVLPYSAT